ncbi:MAG: single-stranded DNA-binding protein [Thiotrichales bacterium]
MVNRVILIGNLGRDCEYKKLENGASVAKVSIATNDNYKDKSGEWQTQTEWHDVIFWRSLADRAEDLKKGAQIYIEGKLTHRTWEDKDGNSRRITEVVASYFRQLGRREGQSNNFPSAENEPPPASSASTPTNAPEGGAAADDDLPF